VVTTNLPELARRLGTVVTRVLEVDEEPTRAVAVLSVSLLFVRVESKVPEIETEVPTRPIVGVKLVITGAFDAVTVKGPGDGAEPPGAVTVTEPVVAPAGTVTVSLVVLAEITVAGLPLNETEF